jgi:hypothetical protein
MNAVDRVKTLKKADSRLRRSIAWEVGALELVLHLLGDADDDTVYRKHFDDADVMVPRARRLREIGEAAYKAERFAEIKASIGCASDRN